VWTLPEADPVLNPYNNSLVMPLHEFIEHPIAAELLHNGGTLQVLGLTNYSYWPRQAQALRRCVTASSVAREMLLTLATKRLKHMAHVGITERLEESVLSLAADMGACGGAELVQFTVARLRFNPESWAAGLGWSAVALGRSCTKRVPAVLTLRACAHVSPPVPLSCAALNLSSPAYKYTSSSAFTYDEGASDDEGVCTCVMDGTAQCKLHYSKFSVWAIVHSLPPFVAAPCLVFVTFLEAPPAGMRLPALQIRSRL
jgi:hypothetical protein